MDVIELFLEWERMFGKTQSIGGEMDHCDECGAGYIPAKPWQKFCSLRCRNAWHRRLRSADEVVDVSGFVRRF
jgi:hypothetical protein